MATDEQPGGPSAGPSDRFLSFRAGSTDYAIPLEQVSGLADCGAVRLVRGAPPEVLGLAEWRGRLLTVLDLPGLLGEPQGSGPDCLIRLSGTMTRTALRVPAPVNLLTAETSRSECGPTVDVDRFVMVDPTELVSQLEAEILAGNPMGGY
jgi:hypothetical protein